MVKAIIEIPKGDSTRRYFNSSENRFVEVGSLKDFVPVNNGEMPVNYGFTPEAHNPNNNNALDILVVSENTLTVGQELDVKPIAILKRSDGEDKVVAIDKNEHIQYWEDIQTDLRNLITDYFGYKSKIIAIGSKDEAEKYIEGLKSL